MSASFFRNISISALLALSAFGGDVALGAKPSPTPGTGLVTLSCRRADSETRATFTGSYGGISFSVSCSNKLTSSVTLEGLAHADYQGRIGIETASVALDGFWQGTAPDRREQSGVVLTVD